MRTCRNELDTWLLRRFLFAAGFLACDANFAKFALQAQVGLLCSSTLSSLCKEMLLDALPPLLYYKILLRCTMMFKGYHILKDTIF